MCPWIFLYHELNFNPRSHEGSDLCRRWIRRSIMISIHAPTRGATCFTHYDFPFLLYFNPRSHEGSDRYLLIIFLLADRFQSTLPRGERPTSTGKTGTTATISIHAPTRGATNLMNANVTKYFISIHAPTRGATIEGGVGVGVTSDFNPRSHEGSDTDSSKAVGADIISIHAPTRGATRDVYGYETAANISIHAPTRGATRRNLDIYVLIAISIHAPTRGATAPITNNTAFSVFQSTLPRGERLCAISVGSRSVPFQSTLPRGERLAGSTSGTALFYFNPRSHEGSDPRLRSLLHPVERFQSTLPRGERPAVIKINSPLSLFQSTLPRGERQQFSPKSSLFSQQKLSKIFNLNNKLF